MGPSPTTVIDILNERCEDHNIVDAVRKMSADERRAALARLTPAQMQRVVDSFARWCPQWLALLTDHRPPPRIAGPIEYEMLGRDLVDVNKPVSWEFLGAHVADAHFSEARQKQIHDAQALADLERAAGIYSEEFAAAQNFDAGGFPSKGR